MNLYVELETLKLVRSVTDRRELQSFSVKRGDALPLTVRFLQDQTATRLDASTVISFAFKEAGKYDDDPVVLEQTFTASTVDDPDSDPHYTASPGLNTTELNDLFLIDADSSNDPASVALMGELSWKATGDDGPTSIKTFEVVCQNDVFRGDEEILPSIDGDVPGVAASAVLTFLPGTTDETIVIDGVTYYIGYADNSPAANPDYTIAFTGIPSASMATVLAEWINDTGSHAAPAHATVSAVASGYELTVTARETGTAGNSIAVSSEDGLWDGATLAGGIDSRFFTRDDFLNIFSTTEVADESKANFRAQWPRIGFIAEGSTTSFNAASWTPIVFANQDEDTNSAWNGSVFTAPEDGIYEVNGCLAFAQIDDGNRYIIGVSVNSASAVSYLLNRGISGGSNICGGGGAVRVKLEAGDVLRLMGYAENATSAQNTSGYNTFSAYLIRG